MLLSKLLYLLIFLYLTFSVYKFLTRPLEGLPGNPDCRDEFSTGTIGQGTISGLLSSRRSNVVHLPIIRLTSLSVLLDYVAESIA